MDLPALVFAQIFECHLTVKDQVMCTQVCRKWRSIIDPFQRRRLFLHFGPFPWRKRSCTNETIKYQDSFEIKSIEFLRHSLTRSNFKRIKQLTVFNVFHDSNPIEFRKSLQKYLYYFKELEYLELDGFSLADKSQLNLKTLKTLSLKSVYAQKQFELNLPNLQNFISWSLLLDNVTIKHPNSIRYMQYYNHQRDCRFKARFENLEVISVYDVNGFLLKNFLSRLPSLKTLILYSQMSEEDFRELKRQRNDVFYLRQLQIHHFGYDESLGYRGRFMLHHYFNNQLTRNELINTVLPHLDQLVDGSPWPVYIHYVELIDAFRGAIPERFFYKFVNFYKVHLKEFDLLDASNRLNLTRFLTRSGFLNYLTFENCSINQSLLDQLHVCSSLINLEFIEQANLSELNFAFLSRLSPVSIFIKNCRAPVGLIDCFSENRHLKSIEFSSLQRIGEIFEFRITFKSKNSLFCLLDQQKETKKFKQLNSFKGFLRNNEITNKFFIF